MTFTALVGTACMFPLRAIIAASVALRIHPNTLTLIGVLLNITAAWALAIDRFLIAGVFMIAANIFDFIDGKVAHLTNTVSRFGAFWDSTLDRFSDIALFLGLIYLYADMGRTDYVMVAALAMMFSIMTSYTRARAESLIDKCKVGFMERPERIVLFMIGAFTDRMAAALWVILILSIVTVINRIHFTYLALNNRAIPAGIQSADRRVLARVLLAGRTDHRAVRPLGDRDPDVRVADAARLARRPDRGRRGPAGVVERKSSYALAAFLATFAF